MYSWLAFANQLYYTPFLMKKQLKKQILWEKAHKTLAKSFCSLPACGGRLSLVGQQAHRFCKVMHCAEAMFCRGLAL